MPSLPPNWKKPPDIAPAVPIDFESVKAERIARSVALNSASEMTASFARVFAVTDACKGYSDDKISGLLRAIKHAEYHDNLTLLGVEARENDRIPF